MELGYKHRINGSMLSHSELDGRWSSLERYSSKRNLTGLVAVERLVNNLLGSMSTSDQHLKDEEAKTAVDMRVP